MNPARNPLFRYLIRPDSHKTLWVAARFGLNIVAWFLLAMGFAAVLGLTPLLEVNALICSYGVPIVIFAPLWITQSSAHLYRDITRRLANFDLVYLTPLTERDILMGVFYTVLYRARFGLVFIVATILLLVIIGTMNPTIQPGRTTLGLGLEDDLSTHEYVLGGFYWGVIGLALILLYPLGVLLGFSAFIGKALPGFWISFAWARMLAVMVMVGVGAFIGLSGDFGASPTLHNVATAAICCPLPIVLLALLTYSINLYHLRRMR